MKNLFSRPYAKARSSVMPVEHGPRVRGVKLGGGGQVQKTNQNQKSQIDDTSAGRTASIWDAANQAANSGPGPLQTQAGQTFSGYQNAGALGIGALSGDPNAAKQFMNPYQQQVIDANNANLNKTNQQTINTTNDAATKAGAFGGSRHGVAEGVALSNNDVANQAQNAQLLQSGYNTAMGQAGAVANLGFGAAQQGAALGAQGVGDPNLYKLSVLKQGYLGPQGQTTGGSQTTSSGGGSFSFGF